MTTYLSPKQISANFGFCMSTVWNLIREIRGQVEAGRYDDEAILSGCGTRLRSDVLVDYLKNRRALKDEYARQYVPPFSARQITVTIEREEPVYEVTCEDGQPIVKRG